MKQPTATLARLGLLLAASALASCMTRQAKIGGVASLLADPAHIFEGEAPPPQRPNAHFDPVTERFGAFNLRWVEDLEKTATNDEPDPDAEKPPIKKSARNRARG